MFCFIFRDSHITKPWISDDLNFTVIRALKSLDLQRQLDEAKNQLEAAYQETVVMLCLAAEGKDQDTASHLYRVQHYTQALAIAVGVDEKKAMHMGLMSMLHDIGKLATPDAILKKPGKLTDEKWVVMRDHPLAGVRILGTNPFYEMAREISAGHHENFDGTGYPNQLAGENIPLSARVFDALTTKRPYKEPWTMQEALENIESHSTGMFDPKLVAAFKVLFENGTLVEIKNNYV
jgi:putative two-component system response regulator